MDSLAPFEQKRAHRLSRAAKMHACGGGHDFLLAQANTELLERMTLVKRNFKRGLATFGRTGALAAAMTSSNQVDHVDRLELADGTSAFDYIAKAHDDLDLPAATYDVILSPFGLHFAQDLPGALIQLRRALSPDGLFLATLPGPDTLKELRECILAAESETTGGAVQRFDPMVALADAGSLLQRAGFALPVVDRDLLTVRYSTFSALIADLRGWGANRAPQKDEPPLTRAILKRAEEIYHARFADADGKLRTTIEMISLQGWVPHESQQKPLARGSAKMRLADALNPKQN